MTLNYNEHLFLIVAAGALVISLAIWGGGHARRVDRFLMTTLLQSAMLWALMRYFASSENNTDAQLFLFQTALVGGAMAAASFISMATSVTGRWRSGIPVFFGFATLMSILAYSKYGIITISTRGAEIITEEYGVGYLLYTVFFISSFTIGGLLLVTSGRGKNQLSNDSRFFWILSVSVASSLTIFGIIPDLLGSPPEITGATVEAVIAMIAVVLLGVRLMQPGSGLLGRDLKWVELREPGYITALFLAITIFIDSLTVDKLASSQILVVFVLSTLAYDNIGKFKKIQINGLLQSSIDSFTLWSKYAIDSPKLDRDSFLSSVAKDISQQLGLDRITLRIVETKSPGNSSVKIKRDVTFRKRVSNSEELESSIPVGNMSMAQMSRIDQMLGDTAAMLLIHQRVAEAANLLNAQNTKLMAKDQSKDESIAHASHQLRTPISVASINNKMMLEGMFGELSDIQKGALHESQNNIESIESMINELLETARIDGGTFEVSVHDADLVALMNRTVSRAQKFADTKNIHINFIHDVEKTMLPIDKTKLEEAASTVIENSIVYSPEGSSILIVLRKSQKQIEVSVKDEGLGIDKRELNLIFKKFGRTAESKKMRPDGLGLGLYLAKKTVEAHGGDILVKSKLGEGSTFTIVLPRS